MIVLHTNEHGVNESHHEHGIYQSHHEIDQKYMHTCSSEILHFYMYHTLLHFYFLFYFIVCYVDSGL